MKKLDELTLNIPNLEVLTDQEASQVVGGIIGILIGLCQPIRPEESFQGGPGY